MGNEKKIAVVPPPDPNPGPAIAVQVIDDRDGSGMMIAISTGFGSGADRSRITVCTALGNRVFEFDGTGKLVQRATGHGEWGGLAR